MGMGVVKGASIEQWQLDLVTDPQTSGGLLISCAPSAVGEVLELFHAQGFTEAAVIGTLEEGVAGLEID